MRPEGALCNKAHRRRVCAHYLQDLFGRSKVNKASGRHERYRLTYPTRVQEASKKTIAKHLQEEGFVHVIIKRQNPSKTLRDLYGIWYVASQLGDFSEQALAEFSVLRQKHPKWSQTFIKNLRDWEKDASPSDWSGLEAQEPSGGLKKPNFERVIHRLLTLPNQ